MKVILTLLIVFFSLQGRAIDKIRNGGTVLVCGTQYQTLDLYEAQKYFENALEFPQEKNLQDSLQNLVGRIAAKDPARADQYRHGIQDFFQNSKFVADVFITPIHDLGEGLVLPQGCQLEQAVSQVRNATDQSTRFLVNKALWEKLSSTDQAALVLHEVIYSLASEEDPNLQNSMGVRWFNGYLHTQSVQRDSLKSYVDHLISAGFLSFSYNGISVRLQERNPSSLVLQKYEVKFTDDDRLLSGSLAAPYEIQMAGNKVLVQCLDQKKIESITVDFFTAPLTVRFESSCGIRLPLAFKNPSALPSEMITQNLTIQLKTKSPTAATIASGLPVEVFAFAYRFPTESILIAENSGQVKFSETGALASASIVMGRAAIIEGSYLKLQGQAQKIQPFTIYEFTFNADGTLQSSRFKSLVDGA